MTEKRNLVLSLLIAFLILAVSWIVSANKADAGSSVIPPITRPCAGEGGFETYPCAWDSLHEGNGKGRSYILNKRGERVYVPHVYAHRLRWK